MRLCFSLLSLSRPSARALSLDASPRALASLLDSMSFSACLKTTANESSAIFPSAAALYRANALLSRSIVDWAPSSSWRSRPESDAVAVADAAGGRGGGGGGGGGLPIPPILPAPAANLLAHVGRLPAGGIYIYSDF